MKLLLKGWEAEDRQALLRRRLTTGWEIDAWDSAAGDDALAAALAEADAMVTMYYTSDTPAAPRLRLLQLPGAGFEGIDFDAVPPACAVCNVFEHEGSIAEYVLAAMLEWVTGLSRMHARLRKGDWGDSLLVGGPLHGELAGKTVGIIGYGHIGREVARRARAFDVRVIAVTRSPIKRDENVDRIAGPDGLDALLGEADFVVVSCPLTPETRGLIDAARLAKMKAGGVLINVARGAVVDEDALYEACRDRTIGGAVIDVWYNYPEAGSTSPVFPSKHPFHELDNVYMTPHAAAWTEGLHERRWSVIAENLDRLAKGEPLLNLLRAPREPRP
ncbi:MAG: 2-hydroxyacid dehydrogenase [Alphaproteobacteria bacterium]